MVYFKLEILSKSMGKNYFLKVFFLCFSFFLQAQEIQLAPSGNKISDWEHVISQVQNSKSDLSSLKNFLNPLKSRNSKSDIIIYDALLANSYATHFDKVNDKSDYYYKKSISNAKKFKNASLDIWVNLHYADYLYNYRQMTSALPVFISVIDKIEQLNPNDLLFPAESFTKIGFFMGTIGDNVEAIKYLEKAHQFAKPRSSEYAKISDNLGLYFFKIGDLKKAKKHFEEAANIAKSIEDELRYAKALGNLALIYERNWDFAKAVALVKEDIEISERNKSDQNTMYAYTLLTRLLIANNQIAEAKESAEKANEIAKSKSYFKINELEILKLRLTIFNKEQKGDDELAIRRRIGILEDSLNKTDGVLPLNQANWLVQKRKYQQDIELAEKKLSSESFWKNVIFIIAGFLILSVVLILVNAKRREKKKKQQMENKIIAYENAKLRNEQKLLEARRTLDAQINFLKEKNVQIQKLHTEIKHIKESTSSNSENEQGKLDEILKSHLMTEENWLSFKREFKKEYGSFLESLEETFPEITDSNLRVILLQKLGFTNAEISGLLGITIDAVKKSKQRLKHKLGDKSDLLFDMIASSED